LNSFVLNVLTKEIWQCLFCTNGVVMAKILAKTCLRSLTSVLHGFMLYRTKKQQIALNFVKH